MRDRVVLWFAVILLGITLLGCGQANQTFTNVGTELTPSHPPNPGDPSTIPDVPDPKVLGDSPTAQPGSPSP